MSYLNFELICGDSLEELKKLNDNLFQTCITSPPYWALRDYDEDGQIGQEQTLEDYVENIVNICFEIKRVLRDDGTFWLNLGSTYCGTGHKKDTKDKLGGMPKARNGQSFALNHKVEGFKSKDLIPIPWMVAQALQKPILKCNCCGYEGHYIKWGILPDYQKWCPHCKSVVSYQVIEQGWFLRIDNIWRKNNPVPAPVQDRPTMGHEYLFLFSKSKKYFYDHYAIMEEAQSSNKKSRRVGAKNPKGTNRKDQGRFFAGGEKRNKRSVWDASVSRYKGAHFACVDQETECLTLTGWKRYDELKIGEMVATFDYEKTKQIRWERLEDIYVYDVDNIDMIEITNLSANFILTPNHRMVCKRKNKEDYYIKEIQDFSEKDLIPISGEWEDGSFGLIESPSVEIAELLGWISSEGHYRDYAISIYQSITANPEKCKRIEFLLDKCELRYKKCVRTRKYKGKDNQSVCFTIRHNEASLLIRSYIPFKKPTLNMILWDKKSIEAYLNGFILGDGCIRKDDKRICIIQKDKISIDILQILALKCGYRATLSKRKDQDVYVLYLTDKRHISFRATGGKGLSLNPIKYSGKIWCPKTPSTTFIARRNGRVMITGNTFPEELISPCILAGSSAHGCCTKCNSPWKRILKREKVIIEGTDKYITNFKSQGWEPTCDCGTTEVKPCLVLDPFNGAATTGVVSLKNESNYVGIDINQSYLDLSKNRLIDLDPIFISEDKLV